MAIKSFSTGEVLTASDTNAYLANSGLVYVTSTTVPTAASSVTIQNAFNTTYDAYRVVLANVDGSAASSAIVIELVDSGGTVAPATYSQTGIFLSFASTTVNALNQTAWDMGLSATNFGGAFELYNPFLAVATYMTSQTTDDTYLRVYGGKHTTAASYTGIKLAPNTGTMSGGTITVYGYRKA